MSDSRSFSSKMGIPFGYKLPESSGGYFLFAMFGIWVAVNATTSNAALFRKKTLKLWNSWAATAANHVPPLRVLGLF